MRPLGVAGPRARAWRAPKVSEVIFTLSAAAGTASTRAMPSSLMILECIEVSLHEKQNGRANPLPGLDVQSLEASTPDGRAQCAGGLGASAGAGFTSGIAKRSAGSSELSSIFSIVIVWPAGAPLGLFSIENGSSTPSTS